MILVIILVGFNISRGGFSDPSKFLFDKLMILPGIIIGLSFHEFAHAVVSYKLGDPTPKAQGRVTLNPLAHIDVFGFFALLVAGFGWGKPVMIDDRYYKHPRSGKFLVSIAGVTMNFILAILFAIIIKVIIVYNHGYYVPWTGIDVVIEILMNVVTINLVLMIFNLIPVPPLDGFNIVTEIFDLSRYSWYETLYRNGFAILMILILFNVTDIVLTPGIRFFYRLIFGMLGIY